MCAGQRDCCTMAREGVGCDSICHDWIQLQEVRGISYNGTDDIMFEDVCRCLRPLSAMPTTRNQTRIRGMTPPCRYRQRSSTATTKVILKYFNYDMI